jgi:hypothetical protein
VLSGYANYEVEAETTAQGADSVLPKPQPLPELAHLAFALMAAAGG